MKFFGICFEYDCIGVLNQVLAVKVYFYLKVGTFYFFCNILSIVFWVTKRYSIVVLINSFQGGNTFEKDSISSRFCSFVITAFCRVFG